MTNLSGYLSLPIMLIAVVVQSTLVPEARIGGGMPDLIYLSALAWTLMAGFQAGLIWALVGGILNDLVSITPLGTTSLALVLVVAAASLIVGQVNPRNAFYPALAAAIGTPIYHGIVLSILMVLQGGPPLVSTLLYVTLPSMVYNLIVMVPVYRILGTFFAVARPRHVSGLE